MKFCKDCKSFLQYKDGLMGQRIEVKICTKFPPEHDLVTGEPLYRFANVERVIINEPDHCGKEGKWFTPIVEDADLDDLSTIPFGK